MWFVAGHGRFNLSKLLRVPLTTYLTSWLIWVVLQTYSLGLAQQSSSSSYHSRINHHQEGEERASLVQQVCQLLNQTQNTGDFHRYKKKKTLENHTGNSLSIQYWEAKRFPRKKILRFGCIQWLCWTNELAQGHDSAGPNGEDPWHL